MLRPDKNDIGDLKIRTVGENTPGKINKTILLVGETGSGKSSLINALVNYAMGVTWEDGIWFHIVEEEKKSQSESQTSDVIVYKIFGFEGKTLPYSLTIIDTPGFGDTRGLEYDNIVSRRLYELFRTEDGVKAVNAVALVLKASVNRVSDRLLYVFDSVMSLLGKNMEKNIVALITYSDGLTPKDTLQALEESNIKCAKNEKNLPLHFLFNNSQHIARTEETEVPLENNYRISLRGMKQFTTFLEKTTLQNLEETIRVLEERIRLPACIENLRQRIKIIEQQQRMLNNKKKMVALHREEMMKNVSFTIEVEEDHIVEENIEKGGKWFLGIFFSGATRCKVCKENCHYPGCTHGQGPKSCEIMKDGKCTSCTNKCPVSDHVKDDKIYVHKTRVVQTTLAEMKQEYDKNKKNSEENMSILEKLEGELKNMTTERKKMLQEVYELLVILDEIALNTDSSSTIVHLDFVIDKMGEEQEREKVNKLLEMKNRNKMKGVAEAVRYLKISQPQNQ